MNTTTTDKPVNTDNNQNATKQVDFGNGRYSPLMKETYKAAKSIFRLEDAQAEKLAKQIGSDFGAAMRDSQATGKVSRVNKDGYVTLKEAVDSAKTKSTPALYAMRALQFAADAGKNGFMYSTTKWTVDETIQEYFDTL